MPIAIDKEAPSINHSPVVNTPAAKTVLKSPANRAVINSAGNPISPIPIIPTNKPRVAPIPILSLYKTAANTATVRGCESISNEPSPALVRTKPCAKKP